MQCRSTVLATIHLCVSKCSSFNTLRDWAELTSRQSYKLPRSPIHLNKWKCRLSLGRQSGPAMVHSVSWARAGFPPHPLLPVNHEHSWPASYPHLAANSSYPPALAISVTYLGSCMASVTSTSRQQIAVGQP